MITEEEGSTVGNTAQTGSKVARYPLLVVKVVNTDELSEGEGKVRQPSSIRERILKGSMKLGDRNRLHTSTLSK